MWENRTRKKMTQRELEGELEAKVNGDYRMCSRRKTSKKYEN